MRRDKDNIFYWQKNIQTLFTIREQNALAQRVDFIHKHCEASCQESNFLKLFLFLGRIS